jgi:hypothetical protein
LQTPEERHGPRRLDPRLSNAAKMVLVQVIYLRSIAC